MKRRPEDFVDFVGGYGTDVSFHELIGRLFELIRSLLYLIVDGQVQLWSVVK
jgi:hypothetical protein